MEENLNVLQFFGKDANFKCRARSPTEWIGMDRFQKIIYGIQCDGPNIRKTGNPDRWKTKMLVKKFCLFAERIEIIKLILFEYEKRHHYDSYFLYKTLSMNGDFIGILSVKFESENSRIETFYFYLICIETGSVKRFKPVAKDLPIFNTFYAVEEFESAFQLLHSNELGWFCIYTNYHFNNRYEAAEHEDHPIPSNVSRYYQLDIDENSMEYRLPFLMEYTQPGNDKSFTKVTCVDNQLVSIYAKSLLLYDCDTGRRTTRQFSTDIPYFTPQLYTIFGKNLQNFYMLSTWFVQGRWYKCDDALLLKFNADLDRWEESNTISKTIIENMKSNGSINTGVAGSNFATIIFIDTIDYRDKRIEKLDAYLKHCNILCLKDLCFRTLSKSFKYTFKSYSETEIIHFLRLPCTLSRQYFGPQWSVDAIAWSKDREKTSNLCSVNHLL